MPRKPLKKRTLPQRKYLVAVANFYVQFLSNGFVNSFGILLPVIVERYDIGEGEASWIGSIAAAFLFLTGPLASFFTKKYGYRVTTIAGSAASTVGLLITIFAPNVYFMFGSFGVLLGEYYSCPITSFNPTEKILELDLLRNVGLVMQLIAGLFNSMAFYIPLYYITNYAVSVGIDKEKATLLVSIIGMCGLISRPFSGWLVERRFNNVIMLFGFYSFLSSAVTFAMLFCTNFTSLLIITIAFGVLATPYVSMAVSVIRKIVGLEHLSSAFGLWLFSNGIGIIISPPISGWIYDFTQSYIISLSLAAAMFLASTLFIVACPVFQYFRHVNRHREQVAHIYVIPTEFV